MEGRSKNTTAYMAVHAGSILRRELAERGITQKEFAKAIGMQSSHLNEIIKGKRNITMEIAMRFETVLHIKATVWMNLQAQYEYDCRIIEQRGIEEKAATQEIDQYDKIFDIRTIANRLGILAQSNTELLRKLKECLGITSPAEMEYSFDGLFRKSDRVGCDARMINTWRILAEYYARQAQVSAQYNEDSNAELVAKLKAIFHENKNTIARVHEVMAEYGIRFSIVEKVDGASIDGYSFWIDENSPAIVVTTRRTQIDSFAFSVMHEIGHLALHRNIKNYLFINCEDGVTNSAIELEADKYAANVLISNAEWNELPKVRLDNIYRIQNTLAAWAKNKGFNEWIVIGRLAHETGMWKFRKSASRNIN